MTTSTIDRDQVAQETAEYIANVLMPRHDEIVSFPGIEVNYVDGKRPPRSVDDIKATLLSGHCWISWMDDRVTSAMRALYGEPTGDAKFIAPESKQDQADQVTVQHIWCAHCQEPYTVPLNFQGCPVCKGMYCADETSCVEVQGTETIGVLEWRRRVRAGCMSDPVTDGGDTLNMIDRAIDKCRDLLGHVQSGQSDPVAYELAHDLLRQLEYLSKPTAHLVMTAREMKAGTAEPF